VPRGALLEGGEGRARRPQHVVELRPAAASVLTGDHALGRLRAVAGYARRAARARAPPLSGGRLSAGGWGGVAPGRRLRARPARAAAAAARCLGPTAAPRRWRVIRAAQPRRPPFTFGVRGYSRRAVQARTPRLHGVAERTERSARRRQTEGGSSRRQLWRSERCCSCERYPRSAGSTCSHVTPRPLARSRDWPLAHKVARGGLSNPKGHAPRYRCGRA